MELFVLPRPQLESEPSDERRAAVEKSVLSTFSVPDRRPVPVGYVGPLGFHVKRSGQPKRAIEAHCSGRRAVVILLPDAPPTTVVAAPNRGGRPQA